MRGSLIAGIAVLLAALPARAASSVSYSQTTGPQSFDGRRLDVRLGDSSFFGGSYESFSSDASTGTYKTYTLRLGDKVEDQSWEIFGSVTPKVNLYQAKSVGFVVNAASDEQTQAHVGYTRIWHSDGVPQPVDIGQNDLSAGLTYTVAKTVVSGRFTKSLYDHDITSLSLRPAAYVPIPGVAQSLQDYPNWWVNGRVEQGLTSWLKVSGSYTRVQYKVGSAGSADSYAVGATAFWRSLSASIQYDQFIPGSGDANKYVTFGASLGF